MAVHQIEASAAMIESRNLIKRHGQHEVLKGISLKLTKGETAVIIGPSGGSRARSCACINGLETFRGGEILVDELRLAPDMPPRVHAETLTAIRQRVGMVFSNGFISSRI